MVHYLDTSGAVKLVLAEAGSAGLRRWVEAHPGELAGSDLLRTELLRAVRRTDPGLVPSARKVLGALLLFELTSEIFERAASLDPPALRSLDALHLAVALEVGDELAGVITYDARFADAARAHGLAVVAPR